MNTELIIPRDHPMARLVPLRERVHPELLWELDALAHQQLEIVDDEGIEQFVEIQLVLLDVLDLLTAADKLVQNCPFMKDKQGKLYSPLDTLLTGISHVAMMSVPPEAITAINVTHDLI